MECGRVSHTWYVCVVGHVYAGLGMCRDGGGGSYACRTKPGVGSMSGDAGALHECEVIH